MFAQILYTQLKWTRPLLALMSVLAFGLPMFIWNIGGQVTWGSDTAIQVMSGFAFLGPSLAVVAIASGFLAVAYVWSIDAAARHVYPLSLPVSWPRYAGMRFAAGTLSLLIPTLALLLGCLFVLALVELPPTLRAYPFSVTIRFFLGATLAYALTFLLQYLLGRRAVVTLLIVLLSFVAVVALAALLGLSDLLDQVAAWLLEWPGPLAIYAEPWALIDV